MPPAGVHEYRRRRSSRGLQQHSRHRDHTRDQRARCSKTEAHVCPRYAQRRDPYIVCVWPLERRGCHNTRET
jgi:hypothetical protein